MADLRKGLVYSCAFIGTLASNAILALIPDLRDLFNASTAEVLLSISFYMFFFAFFSLFTGAISDLIGRRRILLIGLTLYATGCMLTTLADDLVVFYISRAVQGLGFAFVQPVLMAVLGDIAPPTSMGGTMGWLTAATMGGITLGPLVAGYAAAIDWRLAFIFIALATVLLAILIGAVVKLTPSRSDGPTFRMLRSTMATAVRRRGVQMLALTGFLHVLIWIGTQAFTSDRLGGAPYLASAGQIGEILAIAGLASVVFSRFGGGLADRVGRLRTIIMGNILMVLPLLAMAAIELELPSYALLLAIFAIGSVISWAGQLTVGVEIEPSMKGTVSSMFTSAAFTGGALSTVLLSPVQGSLGISYVYVVGAVLCGLMCLTASLAVMDMRRTR